MAFWTMGNHADIKKQSTLAATSSATMNWTRNNLPNEALEKAATPPKVIGCHGGEDAGVSIVERGENNPSDGDN